MRKGSTLGYYERKRNFLNKWKFGHELKTPDQLYLLVKNPGKGLEWLVRQRFLCKFDGNLDKRFWKPIHESV